MISHQIRLLEHLSNCLFALCQRFGVSVPDPEKPLSDSWVCDLLSYPTEEDQQEKEQSTMQADLIEKFAEEYGV